MKKIILTTSLISLSVFSFCSINACKKSSNCYDAALEAEFKDKGCLLDCPGVTGCDGKTYCNECLANSAGIRVK
jgi:hypothetical protein